MTTALSFVRDCLLVMLRGGLRYYAMLAVLGVGALVGVSAYAVQVQQGLIVTGMSDQVAWGVYIANFTFLVGLAAAAVMVVIPAYIFDDESMETVVPVAEAMAVAACSMALLFVVVDLGRPDRMLNVVPLLNRVNFPRSLLAWDVIVVPGYLLINLLLPAFLLFARYRGRAVSRTRLLPLIVLTVLWAIALHVVTAFLYVADVAKPFWHSALLGPRFLASAFASGPALLLAILHLLDRLTSLQLTDAVRRSLLNIATVALQVNLVMLGAELFTELYRPTEHSLSAHYLFVGLDGADALVPWIRSAIAMELVAVVVLMSERLRSHTPLLLLACGLTVAGIWIEKGMGLVVPGFVPSPLGEVVEYVPTAVETLVSFGLWCVGAIIFVLLVQPVIAMGEGKLSESP
jgi:molybdopterin-containing oxidoreductase family membrane subunit